MNTAQQCQLPQPLARHEGKVYFMHLRVLDRTANPKGGYTVAYRIGENGIVEYAVAKCRLTTNRNGDIVNKKSDNFCKRIGRETAVKKLHAGPAPQVLSDVCPLRLAAHPHKEVARAVRGVLPRSVSYYEIA